MCLRFQLTDSQSNVKVIEVFPPAVQSKLILFVPISSSPVIIYVTLNSGNT